MRIFIHTVGSHGDVHPFLAIGRVLRARGHQVAVFCHPYFADDVAAVGLEHVPIAAHIDLEALMRDPRIMDRHKGGPTVFQFIAQGVPSAMETHRREFAARRPDVVLTHHIAFGSRWLCREADVPCAVAVLSPLLWLSRSDPVPTLQQRPGRVRALVARAVFPLLHPLASLFMGRYMNRLRRIGDFPPSHESVLEEFRGGDVNLGLWSTHFRAATPHDPPRGRITGFPWYDRSDVEPSLPADLEAFLAGGDPPVVFTLGTAAVHMPGDFYQIAAEACRRLGCRGLLLTGRRERAPRDLPPGVFAAGYAPFSLVLPRGAATVHHGGIGSTAQALRAGRPFVAVPHAHDQFNNALRARSLGVAEILPRHRLTVRRLITALARVLDDRAVVERARRLGEAVRTEDGANVAATEVEGIARRRSRD